MEGDSYFDNTTSGNISDVPISFSDLPENPLEVKTSAAGEEEKDGGNVSDDLHSEIESLRLQRSDLQRKLSGLQQDLVLKSLEAQNAGAEADRKKNELENHARDLEGQIADLKKVKESEAFNFLKKESELKLIVEELNFKVEKEMVALMKKEEEINALTETLNKGKEELEAEKEKRSHYDAKEKEMVTSFEEKLLVVREKCEELEAETLKARLALEKKEQVIASLTEELRIEREKGEDILELEKKFVTTMTEKEREIASLKKDFMLANENHEFMSNKLDEELKQLKYLVSKLEERIKKILSGDEDGVFLQTNRGMKPKKVENELKFSWVTTTAIITSTGTIAAAITALCLRHKKQG